MTKETKQKNYAEVLKGRNHGQPEYKKTDKDTYSRRPSKFKQQISFNHDHPRQEFNKTTPFTPRHVNLFYGHCFYSTKFGHKVVDSKAYERNN